MAPGLSESGCNGAGNIRIPAIKVGTDASDRTRPLPDCSNAPMNALTWIYALAGVGLNAAAQLLLKSATNKTGAIDPTWSGMMAAAPNLLGQAALWCGLGCYVISVGVWLV